MDTRLINNPMRVGGSHISAFQVDAAIRTLAKHDSFEFTTARLALRDAGAPENTCYRGADRLLQKLRRDGRIKFDKGRWVWTEEQA